MHQTTVRFSAELWEMLEDEAERAGVSVAHFVRDAALSRLAYAAGVRAADGAGAGDFAWADPRRGRVMQEELQARREAPGL